MDGIDHIVEMLGLIAKGVDPATGEYMGIGDLKKDPRFQSALEQIVQTFSNKVTKGAYARFEAEFPQYAILMKEGYFYAAHNKSALVLNAVLGYKLAVDFYKRPTTGGPSYEKIAAALRVKGIGFVLISRGVLVDRFDGEDPFKKYEIDDNRCEEIVLEKMKEYGPADDEAPPPNTSKAPLYPLNLMTILAPDLKEYPEDADQRIETVLTSAEVFPERIHREVEFVRMRYQEQRTLQEIGEAYNLSRERIRQVLNKSLRRMRRAPVLAYLTGETATLDIPRKRAAQAKLTSKRPVHLESASLASEETVSISALARSITDVLKTGTGEKIRYADIASWLVSAGDLIQQKDGDATVAVPTRQGELHGIKRGKRMNASGLEYVGVYLEKNGQEYICENIANIIDHMHEDAEE